MLSRAMEEACDEVLKYGTILVDEEANVNGAFVRKYWIEYKGVSWSLVKVNGVWIYARQEVLK